MAEPRTCSDCPSPISDRSKTGRCRRCAASVNNRRPDVVAKRAAGLRRRLANDPECRAAYADRARHASSCRDMAAVSQRAKDGKIWLAGNAQRWANAPPNSEARKITGARISARKLAHIPTDYRDEYRGLILRGFKAAEAERIVLQQHDKERARFIAQIGGKAT